MIFAEYAKALRIAGGAVCIAAVLASYYGVYHHGRTVERGAQAVAHLEEVTTARAEEQEFARREADRVAKQAARQLAAAKKTANARRDGQDYATQNPRPMCEPDDALRLRLDRAIEAANNPG